MYDLLIFGFGLMVGTAAGIALVTMLNMSRQGETEQEKLKCYEEGYNKGFDDGYELKKRHLEKE